MTSTPAPTTAAEVIEMAAKVLDAAAADQDRDAAACKHEFTSDGHARFMAGTFRKLSAAIRAIPIPAPAAQPSEETRAEERERAAKVESAKEADRG